MKKVLFIIMLCVLNINAQVGINNNDPKAALDISPTSISSPASNDGLLIPRLNAFPATNPGADQNAMMVYLNNDLIAVNISGLAKDYDTGYYFWDNAQTDWINFLEANNTSPGWSLDGNTVTASDFIGTINSMPLRIHVGNNLRMSVTTDGQLIHHNPTTATLIGNGTDGGLNSVVIGELATAGTAVETVVIGNGANTTFNRAVAVGKNASANNQQTVAVGYLAIADGNNSSAFGNNANSSGGNSIAIGNAPESSGANSIAAGIRALASGSNSIAMGVDNMASGSGAIAIGLNSVSSGSASLAMGSGSSATATQSMSFGGNSVATANRSIAIGYTAQSNGNNSTALGYFAEANNSNSTAIGNGAIVNSNNTIRLGNAAVTSVITSGVMSADSFVATGSGTTYPDYVFEDYFNGFSTIKSDYKFNALDEAEAFVKRNGHLPGVKSYTDVMDGGFKLDLTESTIINLEKIEEQFLYITELNKKLKEKDIEIKHQNEKIKSLEERLKRIETLLQE